MAEPTRKRLPKPTALEAFEINMADARHLVRLAQALKNTRVTRMRRELRERVGAALRVSTKRWDELDCLQSDALFVTFLPGSGVKRSDFDDARPLLRQAIVAACSAGETYLADRTMERVGRLSNHANATKRLRSIPLDLGCLFEIDDKYTRKGWGVRGMVIEPYVRREASTDPTKVGNLLSLVGVSDWAVKLDKERWVARGVTQDFLKRVTNRRNKVAHEGDRVGRGRAHLTAEEAQADLDGIESVVRAIETVTGRVS